MSVNCLMEEGTWRLKRHTHSNLASYHDSHQSYISHDCPEVQGRRFWYLLATMDEACHDCGEYPPEAMTGLWKMHNWDNMHNWETM